MKKLIACAVMGMSALGGDFANASDGTITFNGLIIGSSCDISINNGGANQTVTLPTVQRDALQGVGGLSAGDTQFHMSFRNCEPNSILRPFFESTNVNNRGKLTNLDTAENGGATGVAIAIKTVDNKYIDLRFNREDTNPFLATGPAGSAEFFYVADYEAFAAVTTGTVRTNLVYSVQYQ